MQMLQSLLTLQMLISGFFQELTSSSRIQLTTLRSLTLVLHMTILFHLHGMSFVTGM